MSVGTDPGVASATDLDAAVLRFVGQAEVLAGRGPVEHWRTVAMLGETLAAVASAEAAGLAPADIMVAMGPVRQVCCQSPFIARVRDWPRGYPGDFETVEYLVAQANRAQPGTFGWQLEEYTLGSPISQQHRNKLAYQGALISRVLRNRPPATPVAILLLAAGGAADLRLVLPELCQDGDRFVLNDIDPDALAHAQRTLGPLGRHCRYITGNSLRVLGELSALGPYDLVLAGGLYDYLPERAGGLLTGKVLGRLCKAGGTFYFSNISADNPFRLFTDYLANWPLIGRDSDSLRRLVTDPGIPLADVRLEKDLTGLTWLVQAEAVGAPR